MSLSPDPRAELTRRVTRGAALWMRSLGYSALDECRLGNDRRADLIGLDGRGEIMIVEVKSCPDDFRADQKWRDYLDYCDLFCFAVPEGFPQALIPAGFGLIVADGFGGGAIREPARHHDRLPAARRKAMTLMLARLAADRLAHLRADVALGASPEETREVLPAPLPVA